MYAERKPLPLTPSLAHICCTGVLGEVSSHEGYCYSYPALATQRAVPGVLDDDLMVIQSHALERLKHRYKSGFSSQVTQMGLLTFSSRIPTMDCTPPVAWESGSVLFSVDKKILKAGLLVQRSFTTSSVEGSAGCMTSCWMIVQ